MTDDTARPPLDVETLMDAEHRWCVQVEGEWALQHEVEAHRKQAEYILAALQAGSPAQERKITSTDQMEAEQRGLPIPYSEAGSPAQEPWPLTCCAGAVTHAPDCPTGINANPYATATGTERLREAARELLLFLDSWRVIDDRPEDWATLGRLQEELGTAIGDGA